MNVNVQGGVVALAVVLLVLGAIAAIVAIVEESSNRRLLSALGAAVLGAVLLGLFADLGIGPH